MDDMLLGVQVAGRTLKLSQFADDTQFLLRNFDQLARMWAAHRSLRASDSNEIEERYACVCVITKNRTGGAGHPAYRGH